MSHSYRCLLPVVNMFEHLRREIWRPFRLGPAMGLRRPRLLASIISSCRSRVGNSCRCSLICIEGYDTDVLGA